MIRAFILLFLLVMALSCRTGKIEKQEERKSEEQSVKILKKDKREEFDLLQNREDYRLNLYDFAYNFSLSSKDSVQPGRLIESRGGVPFRTLEVVNATYTENKAIKDSMTSVELRALMFKLSNLKKLYNRQNLIITELKEEQEQIKLEGKRLANNFKYGLWVLLLIAFIWIGQSTGLFLLFKQFLKRS